MPRLIIIDPEDLSVPGHHRSADLEFQQACLEMEIDFILLDRSKFRLRTYLSDSEINAWLNNTDLLSEEYERIDIHPGDRILIHTASPWHLSALATRIRNIPGLKIAAGLIYPPSIWTSDPELTDKISQHLGELIDRLLSDGVYLYTETGYLDLHKRRIELPILLFPLSRQTTSNILKLKNESVQFRPDLLRFGFFGQPRAEKGFQEILHLISREKYPGKEFRFFLPQDYKHKADKINRVDGENRLHAELGNYDQKEYFERMATCDAIFCFYNPNYYRVQMSGIITDSTLLGKATLVSRGTEPGNFIKSYAPGSYVSVDYTMPSLHSALMIPNKVWEDCKIKANVSERLLLEVKSADRFLQIACDLKLEH